MRFNKNVPKENQELLLQQLRQYEKEMKMTSDERNELYKWVASGRSPYDNGDYICTDGGYPLDFVNALRFEEEQLEWYQSLSEKEKEELVTANINDSICTNEFSEDGTEYYQTTPKDELPFQ